MTNRVGVFICHCGKNIARTVDADDVVEYAKSLPGVVLAEENLYTCSTDTALYEGDGSYTYTEDNLAIVSSEGEEQDRERSGEVEHGDHVVAVYSQARDAIARPTVGNVLDLAHVGLPGAHRVQVEGVVSFYAFLTARATGKVVIRLCDDVIDRMKGVRRVARALRANRPRVRPAGEAVRGRHQRSTRVDFDAHPCRSHPFPTNTEEFDRIALRIE